MRIVFLQFDVTFLSKNLFLYNLFIVLAKLFTLLTKNPFLLFLIISFIPIDLKLTIGVLHNSDSIKVNPKDSILEYYRLI